MTLLLAAHPIVHVNASLNSLATVLLLVGLYLIKRGRVKAHKRTMLTAFAVSIAFLVCYVWYHIQVGSIKFTHPGPVRYVYYSILLSHVLLAITVPFLATWQIYLGFSSTRLLYAASRSGGKSRDSSRLPRQALSLGPRHIPNLALRFRHGSGGVRDALPSLAADTTIR